MITLRPFTRDEYHEFFRSYVSDPLMDPKPYRYQHEHVDRCFDFDQMRMEWYPVFGVFNEDGAPVGSVALKRIDKLYKRCELGIVMANDRCKNKGYGTAAVREAIRIARKEYGVETMLADTTASNLRMQHILEKLGFVLTEITPHVYDMGDRYEDKLDYSLKLT
ncbi:MAG: GNAT family N-acetyltransferase [Clostridia bacterium]|nr:GNAT family N-acetyltransferase [Clostridia bacterium]